MTMNTVSVDEDFNPERTRPILVAVRSLALQRRLRQMRGKGDMILIS
jgi:hypothetical protein